MQFTLEVLGLYVSALSNESAFPLKTCDIMNDSVDLKFGPPLTSPFLEVLQVDLEDQVLTISLPNPMYYLNMRSYGYGLFFFFRGVKLIRIILLHD